MSLGTPPAPMLLVRMTSSTSYVVDETLDTLEERWRMARTGREFLELIVVGSGPVCVHPEHLESVKRVGPGDAQYEKAHAEADRLERTALAELARAARPPATPIDLGSRT